MKSENSIGRAFLDTNLINFILDHGEHIHDGVPVPEHYNSRVRSDIDVLYNIFLTGSRAMWQFAVSPSAYDEITRTRNPERQHQLGHWFFDLWDYWQSIVQQSDDLVPTFLNECRKIDRYFSEELDILDDDNDRILIVEAIVYRCGVFCTRDWHTILKHRERLQSLPIQILTPTEWWNQLSAGGV